MMQVVLYSRPGCHLCEQALLELRVLHSETRERMSFELTEVNIESDPEIEKKFLFEIPVIEVDGVIVTSVPVEMDVVRAALRDTL